MAAHAPSADVLLVDDRADQRLALSTLLGSVADDVVEAASGREALRWLLQREFAVILLDVNMPDMDGFETAALIRKRRSCEHTPIIFITACADEHYAARGYSLGAVDYVLTPIDPQVLTTKVSVFLELFRKNEQLKLQAESLLAHATRLRRLSDVSMRIHATRAIDELLKIVADAAASLVAGRQVAASVLVPARAPLSWGVGTPAGRHRIRRPERTSLEELELRALATARARPVRMSRQELRAHPEWGRLAAGDGGSPLQGWLAVPLSGTDGQLTGWIQVSEKEGGEFDADDESLIVQLAQMTSIAVENILSGEAREANRIKDAFLATLSHELRTPLQAILTWSCLLREQEPAAPTLQRGLEVIERNARAQTRLIEDLLDVSRIISGKLVLDTRLLSLGELVETACEDWRPVAQSKQIELVIDYERADSQILGDPSRLRQVIANLLSNALKFTPPGGRVEIHACGRGNIAEVTVCDTGEGIAAEFVPHLFERFRQADGGTKRAHGGLGIGLAIVRHLVELHGGSVHAESEGEGYGATFRVSLPLVEAGSSEEGWEKATPVDLSAIADPRLDGIRVLVVDDEPEARECLEVALSRYGATVVAVGSAAEALGVLDRQAVDVLLSDLAMPGEDGFDLMRRVRARPAGRGARIPAAALSAHARAEEKAHAALAGFDLHLPKPIEPVALAATVQSLVARAGR